MEDHGGSERNGERLKGRSFTWRVEDEKIPYRYHLQLSTLLVGRVPGASILSVPCWSCDRSEGRFGKPKFDLKTLVPWDMTAFRHMIFALPVAGYDPGKSMLLGPPAQSMSFHTRGQSTP